MDALWKQGSSCDWPAATVIISDDDDAAAAELLRRGPWTVDEDALLAGYVAAHGEGRWNELARAAGLRRTGKSCRLRWLNYLRPGVRRGDFTPREQLLILDLHSRWGNRWSKIAAHLPGRTDNEVKNYWNSYLKKRVEGKEGPSTSPAPAASADSDDSHCVKPGDDGTAQEVAGANRPADSGSSERRESSSADSSCLTDPPACRPHAAPVAAPKVMFADWLDLDLDMDYMDGGGPPPAAAAAPDLGAAGVASTGDRDQHQVSVQMDGPFGDSGASCWEFQEHFDDGIDQMQTAGFCDLLSMSDYFGLN